MIQTEQSPFGARLTKEQPHNGVKTSGWEANRTAGTRLRPDERVSLYLVTGWRDVATR